MINPSMLLFQPSRQQIDKSQLFAFMRHCEHSTDREFAGYPDFENFCITEFRTFWSLFLEWAGILHDGSHDPVCTSDDCETAVFFPEVRLNYAENLLNFPPHAAGESLLIGCHHDGSADVVIAGDLRMQVVSLAMALQRLGIEPGDRVVAIARNNIEVVIAALATAAIGAVFSSCSHDLGVMTILSRFQQLQPKLLFANCAAESWDIGSLADRIGDVVAGLPSLVTVIGLDTTAPELLVPSTIVRLLLADLTANAGSVAEFVWPRFPFNHPLFILFSSGTTGRPKCIVHGSGGTLLEHVKEHRLHGDVTAHDRLFFQTTCGWMMWNWQLSVLACGASLVVYDGPLTTPDVLWRLVADRRVTLFGTNPAFIQFCETAGFIPAAAVHLDSLRAIFSTGSILYAKEYEWISEHVKPVPVQSISGGTDILGCFVLGNPVLPVYSGFAQCRSLGFDVRAVPPNQIGELICANPFPSRPIGFFGDTQGQNYHQAYFTRNAGAWTHGDLIEITRFGIVMHGRTDGVLNIRGVRIGPAEIYNILKRIPGIVEAMAVEQRDPDEPGGARLILLVVLRAGCVLDDELIMRIRTTLATHGNAYMVPVKIIRMDELPTTFNGKRSETAARDAINGDPIRNHHALLNAGCLDGLSAKTSTRGSSRRLHDIPLNADLETKLCELCEQHLHATPIRPTDNYLLSGGDSLSLLNLLMEIQIRTNSSIPLTELVRVSTVADLAHLLRSGVCRDRGADMPTIRPVKPAETEAVCALLTRGFGRSLQWQNIFEHPWQHAAVPRGFVMIADGRLVGFLGLICTRRSIHGRDALVGNLTSWYVEPAARCWSNLLLASALQYKDVSFTAFTTMDISRALLRGFGFEPLDGTKIFLPPLLHATTMRHRAVLIFEPRAMWAWLDEADRRLVEDHLAYDCLPVVLVSQNRNTAMIIARRRLRPMLNLNMPYSDVFLCDRPDLLLRHLEQIKLALMKRQRTLGLSVSQQLFNGKPPGGIRVPSQTLFRSSRFIASDMDKAYSELVLLPE